jgi:hypothetical protein
MKWALLLVPLSPDTTQTQMSMNDNPDKDNELSSDVNDLSDIELMKPCKFRSIDAAPFTRFDAVQMSKGTFIR